MSNMQAIIQQEAGVYNAVVQLLPTIGMLAETGDNAEQIRTKVVNLLVLQGTPPQNIAAMQRELIACIARVVALHAQPPVAAVA